MISAVELIQRKRDGEELAPDEISELVLGYSRGEVPDYQMAAFCMAVFFRGLSARETFALTDAMIKSGETDRPRRRPRPEGRRQALDRRRGGQNQLALAPLVAACGVPCGKICGRGLGHTGGTLDELEAIPGYRVGPTTENCRAGSRRRRVDGRPDRDLAPADRRSTACATSPPPSKLSLIAASILSKKLAEGTRRSFWTSRSGRAPS